MNETKMKLKLARFSKERGEANNTRRIVLEMFQTSKSARTKSQRHIQKHLDLHEFDPFHTHNINKNMSYE
jgi:hypothetical protein